MLSLEDYFLSSGPKSGMPKSYRDQKSFYNWKVDNKNLEVKFTPYGYLVNRVKYTIFKPFPPDSQINCEYFTTAI